MEEKAALASLAALSQRSRLRVFRLLVQAGPAGLPAGAIAGRLGMPLPTLSFHLKTLRGAGLAGARRDGRRIVYSADFERMAALLRFLTENCCGGTDCVLESRDARPLAG